MAENALIKTLILIFGYLFGCRIIEIGIKKQKLSSSYVSRMKIIVIFLMMSAFYMNIKSLFLFWILVFAVLSGSIVTIFVTFQQNQKKFRQDFVFFIDRTLIQMKLGKSLRSALEISNKTTPKRSSEFLINIIEILFWEGKLHSPHAFHHEILHEMKVWCGLQAKVVKRIQSYRTKLRLEEKFRHKSEQILHQIRIQMIMITLMYASMAFFLVTRFDFYKHIVTYLVSLLLFILGLLGFHLVARRQTWKI